MGVPIVCVFDRVVNWFISVRFESSVGGLWSYSLDYTQIGACQRQVQDAHLLELEFREGYWQSANIGIAVYGKGL